MTTTGHVAAALAGMMLALPLAAQGPTVPPPKAPPPDSLAGIEARGRRLAAYDRATWLGTDALIALRPDTVGLGTYIARETPAGWVVAFGRLTPGRDRFVTRYESRENTASGAFTARKVEPAAVDTGFLRRAALALDLAVRDFGRADRPYNAAVLPHPRGGWWVYLVPAPTVAGVWPHGGDARYRVSADGGRVLERRRMHRSVLDLGPYGDATEGYHTAVVDNVPEDTDVFFVLTRTPRMRELVVTEDFVYVIQPDGAISCTLRHDFEAR